METLLVQSQTPFKAIGRHSARSRNNFPLELYGNKSSYCRKRLGRLRVSHLHPETAVDEKLEVELVPNGLFKQDTSIDELQAAETIPQMWEASARKYANQPAVLDPHRQPVVEFTYRELYDEMRAFAAGLKSLGLGRGDKVSLFSENSGRWLVADQGIMMNGAVDAVRGASTPLEEMHHIMSNSESMGLVVQDPNTLEALLPILSPTGGTNGYKNAQELVNKGREVNETQPFIIEEMSRNDVATLVYTSGTSGHPKGVKLTHGNILYQVDKFSQFLTIESGDSILSLLPPWHIYERSASYHVFSKGIFQVNSSIKTLKNDLKTYQPDIFVCVPLVLDTLYSKVMGQLRAASVVSRALAGFLMGASLAYIKHQRVVNGVDLKYAAKDRPLMTFLWACFVSWLLKPFAMLASLLVHKKIRAGIGIQKAVVSGGGSLASHLDDFYEAIGLPVLNGWGLTETSPVLASRTLSPPLMNVRGSVGRPIPGTELRVVDPESYKDLEDGNAGLILAKGPGVMGGYYGCEEATAKAFVAGDGWFDTGDRGWRCPSGVKGSNMAGTIVLTGRIKDSIVLSNGENIEPQPIEDWLVCSPLIKHIMLVGQDHRSLGALVVPDDDAIAELAHQNGGGVSSEEVRDIIVKDIAVREKKRPDFVLHERIKSVEVLDEPFSVETGTLTRTMKLRREAIVHAYSSVLDRLLPRLR